MGKIINHGVLEPLMLFNTFIYMYYYFGDNSVRSSIAIIMFKSECRYLLIQSHFYLQVLAICRINCENSKYAHNQGGWQFFSIRVEIFLWGVEKFSGGLRRFQARRRGLADVGHNISIIEN